MFIALLLALVLADVRDCGCDPAKPETMEAVNCSLCREAEKQPLDRGVFFLQDKNPSKANRTLALPRRHTPGAHSLADLSADEQTELWTAAIAKGKALWGEQWGIAYNGAERRTQCHGHIHIGKLNDDVETEGFTVIAAPSEIRLPADGSGIWIHPVNGKLHVHSGEQVNETVLMR